MNKKIITALVCTHLLITPTVHAWQLPQDLDGKRIGIVVGITAAVVALIGFASYMYKKRGQNTDEVVTPAALQSHVAEQMAVLRAELAGKHVEKESNDASIQELIAQVEACLKKLDELTAENAFKSNQIDGLLKDSSKNAQIMVSFQQDLERQKNFRAEHALAISELRKNISLAPTREDLARLKRENEIATNALRRFTRAALEKIAPSERRERVPVRIRIDSDEPQATEIAHAINQEATEPKLSDTAEKLQAQHEEQVRQLQKEAARLRAETQKPKSKKQKPAASPAVPFSVQATIPDHLEHSPSEMVDKRLVDVASPFGAASHPLAIDVSAPPTAESIHEQARALLGNRPIASSASKPPREGEELASLSPRFKVELAQAGVLPPIAEGVEVGDAPSDADFGRSLTAGQAEQVQAAASVAAPIDLQALIDELDKD